MVGGMETAETPRELQLATYQAHLLGRLRRCGDVTVEAPTGSGKTLLVRALIGLDLNRPGGFTHALVAAPQEQIEAAFLSDRVEHLRWPEEGFAQPTLTIPAHLFRAARRDGCGTRTAIRRYLASSDRQGALACTHAAIARLEEDDLPPDLSGRLLVIDEAHHVPAEGLSRIAGIWRSRGGRLLFLTATPYRADDEPVVLPGMVHLRRSLPEHMQEGFAPRTLEGEIVNFLFERDGGGDLERRSGSSGTRRYRSGAASAVVQKWEEDGRPKAIVRVPPGRAKLVRRIVAAFERVGARVLDASGTGRDRKVRFLAALAAERDQSVESRIDVIVGVMRVLEGTDWPVCSAVYSFGIPRSIHTVVQLAGRALRKKPADFRPDYRDRARLVFFVPCEAIEAQAQLSLDHSRHTLLLCAFMVDHQVGQSWVVTAAVRRGLRRALAGQPVEVLDAASDATEPRSMGPARAEALLALAASREELTDQGVEPTLAAVVARVTEGRPDLAVALVQQVAVEALAAVPGAIGEQATDRLEQVVEARVRIHPEVAQAMQDAFAAVVVEFREATLDRSTALDLLGRQVHSLTGGAMQSFARRLAAAGPRTLTEKQILAWADEHHAPSGQWPTAASGVVQTALDETWGAIDQALRAGTRGLIQGGSLARLLHDQRGVPNRLTPRELSVERILELAREHREINGDWPTRGSGVLPGTELTWSAIDQALIHGRHGLAGESSLAKLLHQKAARRNVRNLPALDDGQVATWATAFHRDHGRWPKRRDGQIDGALVGETWARIAAAIEQGLRTLRRRPSLGAFLAEVCGAPLPGVVRRPITVVAILEAAAEYHRRNGTWPTPDSVDASLEARGESWKRIDRALRSNGRGLPHTTLIRLLAERAGVRNKVRPGPLPERTIWALVVAHRKRTGEFPTRDSGPVVEAPGESWSAIDGALKHKCRGLERGETLREFIQRKRRLT